MASIFYRPVTLFKQLFAAGKKNTLTFNEIGWAVTLPKGFWLLPGKKLNTISQKTCEAIAITTGKTFETPVYKQLFAAKQMQGLISAGITSLATITRHEWDYSNEKLYNSMYNSLREAYADYQRVNIQTEKERRQKDHIIFNTFAITVSTPALMLSTTRFYACVINNYGLLITICFEDEKTGDKIVNAIRSSAFIQPL